MTYKLVTASNFTIEQLTEAYNHTRVDYMVPMPMNVARLSEYIHLYDIDLEKSLVALEEDTMVGLAMLAVRPNRSWITRLGLITNIRGKGLGQALMEGLIEISDAAGIEQIMLEIISGNTPAHKLFLKLGFQEFRELHVMRRAPHEVPKPSTKTYWMDRGDAIYHLNQRKIPQAWTNQTESLARAKGVSGFHIYTPTGGHGWIVFQKTLFNLSRIMFDTEDGDPVEITLELLKHLHNAYPELDTYTENIPTDDPRVPAFKEIGYLEAFRRIEMHRHPEV